MQNRKAAEQAAERARQDELRSYKGIMVEEKMTSNKDVASSGKSVMELEEDFM